jgi:hypothetical protein
MSETPFLYRFRETASTNEGNCEELYYCLERGLNVMRNGRIAWSARSRRPRTSCHTSGHTIKAHRTRSGKWKNSRWVSGKTDKRAGR